MNRTNFALLASALLGSAHLLFRLLPPEYVPWVSDSGVFSEREALVRTVISGFVPPLISRRYLPLQPMCFFAGLTLTSALLCTGGEESCLPGMLLGIVLASPLILPPLVFGCLGGALAAFAFAVAWRVSRPNKPLEPTPKDGAAQRPRSA